MVKVGIVGGSGMDDPELLSNPHQKEVETPYGKPSSLLALGNISGIDVVILARHGHGHVIPPSQVNYRANLWALQKEGCTQILATTACGSLRKEIERGDFVLLDQCIDFTRQRKGTFFEDFSQGIQHTAMAKPFDNNLRDVFLHVGKRLGYKMHEKGTVVTIEGPRFSTKAESKMFRSLGADVINMSTCPEVFLAQELKLPYAVIAMSTDYDCLFDDLPPVSWEDVLKIFHENAERVKLLLRESIMEIGKWKN